MFVDSFILLDPFNLSQYIDSVQIVFVLGEALAATNALHGVAATACQHLCGMNPYYLNRGLFVYTNLYHLVCFSPLSFLRFSN